MKLSILIILAILVCSCSSNHIVRYIYSFENVKGDEENFVQREIVFGRYEYLYSDKNIELLFDINPYEIGIQFKNPSWNTLRIIWDDIYLETDYAPIKKFDLVHTNKSQEFISLNDTTIENYKSLKMIKDLQLHDTSYVIKPTIILPGMTVTDLLVNKERGYFMPYEMSNVNILNNSASELINKKMILRLKYKINDKIVNLSLNLKIKDYYLLQKG